MKLCGKQINAAYVFITSLITLVIGIMVFLSFVSVKLEECKYRVDIVALSTLGFIPMWFGVIYSLHLRGFTVACHRVATPLQLFLYLITLLQPWTCIVLMFTIQFEKSMVCRAELGSLGTLLTLWLLSGVLGVFAAMILFLAWQEGKYFVYQAPQANLVLFKKLQLLQTCRWTLRGWDTLAQVTRERNNFNLLKRELQDYSILCFARIYILDEYTADLHSISENAIASKHCEICGEMLAYLGNLNNAQISFDPSDVDKVAHYECAYKKNISQCVTGESFVCLVDFHRLPAIINDYETFPKPNSDPDTADYEGCKPSKRKRIGIWQSSFQKFLK